ncbi:hypothetical protein HK151_11455 [Streptococcus agalactiae]|nr:hypothetical protein [Streptococcus agalactiae]MCC9896812.1 hypothetical protein [Streptococcus agalactiae]
MTEKYIVFDEYIINYEDNIIGFIASDIYIELDSDGVDMLDQIRRSNTLFKKSELIDTFKHLDVEDLIDQLIEIGVVKFTTKNKVITSDKNIETNRNVLIKIIYFISAILGVCNICFLVSNFENIFILNIAYFKNTVLLFILMFFLQTVLSAIHELGHFLSARLLNVSADFNISQRFLLFMVFECRMNGVWGLKKSQRVFPMLGGILMDNLIIFICSVLIFFNLFNNIWLFTILFIQYTKMLYHLLIPFKTDLYYLLLFRFHNSTREKSIMKASYFIGYTLIIPLIIIYLIQLINLINYMKSSPITQNILVVIILVVPIMLFFYEKRGNNV